MLIATACQLSQAHTATAATANGRPYHVLILNSFRGLLRTNVDWARGIGTALSASPNGVEVDVESPDLEHISDPAYLHALIGIYQQKYMAASNRVQLIIPTYTPALKFLLDYGDQAFPGVPIVFCDADDGFVAAQKLPPNITGVTSHLDFAGTLQLALQLQPDTRQAAVIAGSGPVGKLFEGMARKSYEPFKDRVTFTWLRGLTLDELINAVRQMPPHTVILYLAELEDRNGRQYDGDRTVTEMTAATHAPFYGLWDTLLGDGVMGGRMVTLEQDGFLAGQMALHILHGEMPWTVPIIHRTENRVILDGGELERWHIDESRLLSGSLILDRPVSVWDKYRYPILGICIIIILEGALIIALLLNRARLKRTRTNLRLEYDQRVQAESAALRFGSRLSRFSKQRNLGALVTAIVHEISQPLISIQNYAQAGKRRTLSEEDQRTKVAELLGKMEHEASRAGEIIQRIRTLVSTDTAVLRPEALDSVLEKVVQIIRPDIESSGCLLQYDPNPDLPNVLVDDLQIQLVMVNLLQNAVHASKPLDDRSRKVIAIEDRQVGESQIQVSVSDRGTGIPSDMVEQIFEPLYTGKMDGMGMGLYICRNILEAHGGRIWCEPNPLGGAIFHFTLRVAGA